MREGNMNPLENVLKTRNKTIPLIDISYDTTSVSCRGIYGPRRFETHIVVCPCLRTKESGRMQDVVLEELKTRNSRSVRLEQLVSSRGNDSPTP
jgi:hypothetical protein